MFEFNNKLKYLAFIALTLVVGIAVTLLSGGLSPHFKPVTLPSLNGERIHIPDQRGRLSWVSSWSASCAVCLHELPELDKLHHQYGEQLSIVALAMPYDPPNAVLEVRDRLQLSVPVLLDLDGEAARQLTPDLVVPSHHLIDNQGNILLNLQGALTRDEMLARLKPYLQPQTVN